MEQSIVDKKIDEREANELKKIYNHYLDKRSEIMENTQLKVEDVLGDILNKESISLEQIAKLEIFQPKLCKY